MAHELLLHGLQAIHALEAGIAQPAQRQRILLEQALETDRFVLRAQPIQQTAIGSGETRQSVEDLSAMGKQLTDAVNAFRL